MVMREMLLHHVEEQLVAFAHELRPALAIDDLTLSFCDCRHNA